MKKTVEIGDLVMKGKSPLTVVRVSSTEGGSFHCRLDNGELPSSRIDPNHWAVDVCFEPGPEGEGLVSREGGYVLS
jgi:hypothetical protein